MPGVRDGAAVVADGPDQVKRLVAFYSGERPLGVAVLRDRLTGTLPEYMVPSAFHWRESLPLTPNGKIDRKTLTALARELDDREDDREQGNQAPSTPTEQRMAAAWATLLGVPVDQIGRHDHFFDRGGDSLTAVKLVIALKRQVSLTDITRYPTLADLAGLVDGRSQRSSGLLQELSEPGAARDGALVCFPYAGGNAVNFRPLAGALRDNGRAVYAVELPGHDLTAENEAFAPMAQIVEQVVAEILERGLTGVMLWGHSVGAAFALATAPVLLARGVEVRRVFLGRADCSATPPAGAPPSRG